MKSLSVCKLLIFSVIASVQVCSAAWSNVESYIIDGTGFYDSDCTILSSAVTGKSSLTDFRTTLLVTCILFPA